MSILPSVERWRPTIDWAFSWVLRLMAAGGCATEIWVDKFRNTTVLIPLAALAGLPDLLGLYRLMRRAVEDDRHLEERDYRRRNASTRRSEPVDDSDFAGGM